LVEPVISHRDVTTTMRLLADIQHDVRVIRNLLEETMEKRKRPKMTPDEHARRDETQRMAQERIAYHEAKAREEEEAAERRASRPGH
jgi:hypothetical protein